MGKARLGIAALVLSVAGGCSSGGLVVGAFDASGGSDAACGADAGCSALSLNPGSADFGMVSLRATSASHTFVVTNTGDRVSSELGVTLSPAAFVLAGDDCTGNSLAPGGFCAVTAALAPKAVGPIIGTLDVTGGASAPLRATLTGIGASLSISVPTASLGCVEEPTTPGSAALAVRNDGTAPINLLSVRVTGSGFYLTGPQPAPACNSVTLSPGSTCNVTVYWGPQCMGSCSVGQQGTITVSDPKTGATTTATLDVVGPKC
jgi:hypothetical protein